MIKNIYAGKPDAKDEINFEGMDDLIRTFVIPSNFNLDNLLFGNFCFISGFKGTGKTALLFYLDNYIKNKDISSCSSFIFFKEEFTDMKKFELETISKRILSSITIEKTTLIGNTDFEYIWRWLLFKRIIADNEEYNKGLFKDDDNWDCFFKTISKIKGPSDAKKNIIPSKIKLGIPCTDPISGVIIAPEIEVDFQNEKDTNFAQFTNLIDEAEKKFLYVNRTDIPYHIFIDELEAFYGNEDIFKRDLYLIRDLIFTVKRFNSLISNAGMINTKIICSIRTEILNAISRFIVTKELNKVTSGFEVPLHWSYSNTNSFSHPIMQILLRRIAISEKEDNEANEKDRDISQRWFPEQIHDIEPANYILNNSWCKPRDIVRLIMSAQNCIHSDKSMFSQAVFDSFIKQYSSDSLVEIKEEMRALYMPQEIDLIINCLTGYRSTFSVNQLQNRVGKYYKNTIWTERFVQILSDLYRLGFIGNYLPSSKEYRWQHKGDDGVILSDEWRLMIHQALQISLSVGKKHDFSLKRNEPPQIGDVVTATVQNIIPSFILVVFDHYGIQYSGNVHISQLTGEYINDIHSFALIGDELKAKILKYDDKHLCWSLSFLL